MCDVALDRRPGANMHCCYGICKSDSRSKMFRESLYYFIRFPKPCTKYRNELIDPRDKQSHIKNCAQCSKCKLWVQRCRRADERFQCIDDVKKDTYICSLHFQGRSGPSETFPDPIEDKDDSECSKVIE